VLANAVELTLLELLAKLPLLGLSPLQLPGTQEVVGRRVINVAGRVLTVTQAGIPLPTILNALVSGKKLFVSGMNFGDRATIYINEEKQKASNDDGSPSTILISKKAAKKIGRGQTVTLTVKNADGLTSGPFSFRRPD